MGAIVATDQSAKQAYEALAPVYDDFTSHHDYELLLSELLPRLRRHGLTGGRRAADVEIADMRELPVFGEFDLVWCLDDGLNHLLSAEEVSHALSGMRANLAPEGLLLFGVNTSAPITASSRRRRSSNGAAGD